MNWVCEGAMLAKLYLFLLNLVRNARNLKRGRKGLGWHVGSDGGTLWDHSFAA